MKTKKMYLPIFVLVSLIILIVSFADFGKPNTLDDKTYDAAKKIIGHVDDYLDMRITGEDARNKIENLEKKLSEGDSSVERSIRIYTMALKTDLLIESPSSDILEFRNKLAKEIGEKKRK